MHKATFPTSTLWLVCQMSAICHWSCVARLSVVCWQTVGGESTDEQPKEFWWSYSSVIPDDSNFETLILFQSKTSDFSYLPEI